MALRPARPLSARWAAAAASAGLAALVAVACTSDNPGTPTPAAPRPSASTAAPTAPATAPEAAPTCGSYRAPRPSPGPDQVEVQLAFHCDAEGDAASLFTVYRLVPRSAGPLRAALGALLRGPDAVERAAGLGSFFGDGTAGALRSAAVRDGHAVVDLHDLRGIIPNASSSAGSARLLAQLDAAVFQFPSVTSAEYRLDGSCEAFGEWLQYGGCDRRTRPPGSPGMR